MGAFLKFGKARIYNMKISFSILALLFFIDASAVENDLESRCETISQYAEGIMIARQNGKPMIETMQIIDQRFKGIDALHAMYSSMITHVYGLPIQQTKENKALAAEEFENEVFQGCMSTPM